jgi:predicted metal-binding membrane protein
MSPVMSPLAAALATIAMMVALMLPSFAPTLWSYYRHLRVMRAPGSRQRVLVFAIAYAGVWTLVSAMLYAISAEVSPMAMTSDRVSFSSFTIGAIVLCAGAVQCSRWKERQLFRCRERVGASVIARRAAAAWTDGLRHGVDCCLSCAAPMAVLFVAGLMDTRMMLIVTGAITAERVMPRGQRVAQLAGAIALVAGFVICVRA